MTTSSTSAEGRFAAIRLRFLLDSDGLFIRCSVFQANNGVKGLSFPLLFRFKRIVKGVGLHYREASSMVTGVRKDGTGNVIYLAREGFTIIRLRLRFRCIVLEFRTVLINAFRIPKRFHRWDIVFLNRFLRFFNFR